MYIDVINYLYIGTTLLPYFFSPNQRQSLTTKNVILPIEVLNSELCGCCEIYSHKMFDSKVTAESVLRNLIDEMTASYQQQQHLLRGSTLTCTHRLNLMRTCQSRDIPTSSYRLLSFFLSKILSRSELSSLISLHISRCIWTFLIEEL